MDSKKKAIELSEEDHKVLDRSLAWNSIYHMTSPKIEIDQSKYEEIRNIEPGKFSESLINCISYIYVHLEFAVSEEKELDTDFLKEKYEVIEVMKELEEGAKIDCVIINLSGSEKSRMVIKQKHYINKIINVLKSQFPIGAYSGGWKALLHTNKYDSRKLKYSKLMKKQVKEIFHYLRNHKSVNTNAAKIAIASLLNLTGIETTLSREYYPNNTKYGTYREWVIKQIGNRYNI